jgi:hypothetical protein
MTPPACREARACISSPSDVRTSIAIPLPPAMAAEMMLMKGEEALEWNDRISSIDVVKDHGPDDRIVELSVKMPWVMKYMMSM